MFKFKYIAMLIVFIAATFGGHLAKQHYAASQATVAAPAVQVKQPVSVGRKPIAHTANVVDGGSNLIDVSIKPISRPTKYTSPVGIGVYMPGAPWDNCQGYQDFESQVSQEVRYVLWFQSMGDDDSRDFKTDWVQCAKEMGITPVIGWEPWQRQLGVEQVDLQPEFSMASFAAGDHDDYIRSWAIAAREMDTPIILRLAHEMDTPDHKHHWYPWQGSPKEFVAGWRHIVDIFRQEQADKVQFIWTPIDPDKAFSREYYPGSDYVDLVGSTMINFGDQPKVREWMKWNSWNKLFSIKYPGLARYGKPILFPEVESAEGKPGQKAEWISQMFETLDSGHYPLIKGAIWFNNPEDHMYSFIDWSINSSTESRDAFRAGFARLNAPNRELENIGPR